MPNVVLHNGRRTRCIAPRALLTSTALASTSLIVAGVLQMASAQSLPTGGTVAAGRVTINPTSASNLVINQTSQQAITNWQSFSIGAGNSVAVVQPSATASMLARVTGNTTSTIAGSLTATGQLMLVNPNGISITPTGTVNAGSGFVATTLGLADGKFLSGNWSLTGTGASNAVTNAGTITVGPGGYAALIGGTVSNAGTISVPMGKVGLGSGEVATLDFSGDGFLQVGVPTTAPGSGALVSNAGKIIAKGGTVEIKAAAARDAARQAINLSGVVEARSVHGTDGDITLDGGEGTVAVSGKLTVASRKAKAGKITVTGRDIQLTGAQLDASGKTGGGTVRIGGDKQGKGTLAHATTTTIDASTKIKADATATGNGGTVVVWSDTQTNFDGWISAKGGPTGGDGGQVEVSSHGLLAYTGKAVLTAPMGKTGTLLLDPYSVTIDDSGSISPTGSNPVTYASGVDSTIGAAIINAELASANVVVQAGPTSGGNVVVNSNNLNWINGNTLTLSATGAIAINGSILGPFATLALNAGGAITQTAGINVGTLTGSAGDNVTLTSSSNVIGTLGAFTVTGGSLAVASQSPMTVAGSLNAQGISLTSGSAITISGGSYTTNGGALSLTTGGNVTIASSGSASGDDVLYTPSFVAGQVAAGGLTLATTNGNVAVSSPVSWSSGTLTLTASNAISVGAPITVSGTGGLALNYNAASPSNLGFGLTGSGFSGRVDFTGTPGQQALSINGTAYTLESSLDALASAVNSAPSGNYALASNVDGSNGGAGYTAAVVGGTFTGTFEGLGHTVSNLSINSTTSSDFIGLFRYATGTIRDVGVVGGSISGSSFSYAGAIVGFFGESVTATSSSLVDSYSTANVTGGSLSTVGGLIGETYATNTDPVAVVNSFSTGAVTTGSSGYAGGLIGQHYAYYSGAIASVSNAYATGTVIGGSSASIGGLVGYVTSRPGGLATITSSYATGAVIGTNSSVVGGLVGGSITNAGTNTISASFATGAVSGGLAGGGGLIGYMEADETSGVVSITDSFAFGAVRGTQSANIGGLAGSLVTNGSGAQATIATSYAAGSVTTTGYGQVGGLVGSTAAYSGGVTPSVTSSYFDTAMAGATATDATNSGQTTAQLQGALPAGFSSSVWGTGTGLYPYLKSIFPNGVQAVSGTVYSDPGATTPLASGTTGAVGVTVIGANTTLGSATTGANGSYYVFGAAGTIANGAGLIAYTTQNATTGATNAARIAASTYANSTPAQTGVDIDESVTLAAGITSLATLSGSGFNPNAIPAIPTGSTLPSFLTGALPTLVATNANGFTLDQTLDLTTGFAVQTTAANAPITVANASTVESGAALGLTAAGALAINAPITAKGAAAISLAYDQNTTTPSVTDLSFGLTASGFTGGITFAKSDGSAAASSQGGTLAINGQAYTLLYSMSDLDGTNGALNLAGNYALAGNLDATDNSYTTGVIAGGDLSGIPPATAFSGTFEGLGHTIANPTINGGSNNYVGLIGYSTGTIRDIGLTGGSVGGSDYVGGLVGNQRGGTISNAYATGAVIGSSYVGGLVGHNSGAISNAYTTGAVSGYLSIGGLAGENAGTIINAYTTGAVSATSSVGQVGGLVGYNGGTISDAYAMGAVSSRGYNAGGLVGYHYAGTISNAYATGAVSGGNNVGGLVGAEDSGTISNAYATGAVSSGGYNVGGLVGYHYAGTISNAYATGAVSGGNNVGGLVGEEGSGTINNAYATGAVSGSSSVGGLVGYTQNGIVSNGYYDINTTGQTTDPSGATGLTTAQLQDGSTASGLGGAFTVTSGLYPFLTSFFPNGVQAISGIAFTNAGATPAASGANGAISVTAFANNATFGSATTGANGYYYIVGAAGSITSGNTLVAYTSADATTGAANSATLTTATAAANQSGLNLYGGTLTVPTTRTTLSSAYAQTSLDIAKSAARSATGDDPTASTAINAITGLGFVASGASFTIDETIDSASPLFVQTTASGAPITVANAITVEAGGSVGFNAAGALTINAPITVKGAGGVALAFDQNTTTPSATDISFGLTAAGFAGGVTFANNTDPVTPATSSQGGTLAINGQAYTLLYNMTGIAGVNNGLSGRYALAGSLDASATAYTDALIGLDNTPQNQFTGTFDGLGHTISNLVINKSGDYAGLFGFASNATIRNIGMVGGSVTGNSYTGGLVGDAANGTAISNSFAKGNVSGSYNVGGLIGWIDGGLINAYATGTVSGSNDDIGGLVGFASNTAAIRTSYATGTVSGDNQVGGLVGYNNSGTISNAHATGAVSGSNQVGGLVGFNQGTISNAYATGAVSGSYQIGGLAGVSFGTISNAYATGAVSGGGYVGGLAGYNGSGTISNVNATGAVSGSVYVGGLVGENDVTISNAYATGAVSGYSYVGGFAGYNSSGTISNAFATGAVSGSTKVGGFVGFADGGATVTNGYYDINTTGRTTDGNGATGLTTAQMQTLAVATNLGSAFAGAAGLYPYLTSLFPNGVQAISGTAYLDSGVTLAASGTHGPRYVYVDVAGSQTAVTTGANGTYYIALANGTLSSANGGTATLAYMLDGSVTGPVSGAHLAQLSGTATNFDVWTHNLIAPTTATSLSAAPSTASALLSANSGANQTLLASAAGSDAVPTSTALGSLSSVGYIATDASGFNIDQGISPYGLYVQTTSGPITVSAAQTLGGPINLSLYSAGALSFQAPVTVEGAGTINLAYDASNPTNLSFGLTAAGFTGGLTFDNANGSGALSINGTPYTLLYSMSDVANVNNNLTGNYALAGNIDPAGTYTGAPIASGNNSFTGTFEGLGHTISGLTVTDSANFNALGLFGTNAGTIRDLGLVGASVATSGDYGEVGLLVGRNANNAILANIYATGTASATGTTDIVGGLVGENQGLMASAFANARVSVVAPTGQYEAAGGLVGQLDGGTISNAYAAGAVSISGFGYAGGLAGVQQTGGSIINAYATGTVSGGTDYTGTPGVIGGLVGQIYGAATLSNVYATGAVSGVATGGLVGSGGAMLTNAYYDINTTGQTLDPSGAIGLTTAQFQTSSAASNFGAAFAGGPGLYPYLKSFYPNGVQTISGTAYSDGGVTAAASNASGTTTVNLDIAGSQTAVTTGANGYYYAALPNGTLSSANGGTATLVYTLSGSAVTGAKLTTVSDTTQHLDIWGNTFIAPTTATSLSSAPTAAGLAAANSALLATAAGSDATPTSTALGALSYTGYIATGSAGFTVDQAVSTNGLYVQTTSGPITVSAAQTLTGPINLTLLSAGALAINAPIKVNGAGSVNLAYDASDPANLSFGLTSNGFSGGLTFADSNGAATTSSAGGALTINGSAYTLLYSMADVANVNNGLAGSYALAGNLDATGNSYSSALVGGGYGSYSFAGAFDGLGHTISNLTISGSSDAAGLFGFLSGSVRNIGVTGGSISGNNYVGGLVGYSYGTISNAFATGQVSGRYDVGGLVGYHNGTISNAYATGPVSGTGNIGGLVGINYSMIRNAYATGAVSGDSIVGGLAGLSYGTIDNAFAMGAVSASNALIGGLIGVNYGTIDNAFAMGAVSGNSLVGGLVASNSSTITNAYWDTDTSGQATSPAGTGNTTAQLQTLAAASALGSAFGGGAGLYPYLVSLNPNGVQAVSGTAYTSGTTVLASGTNGAGLVTVKAGNASQTVSTGANGTYYAAFANGTIDTVNGTGVLAFTQANSNTGATNAAAFNTKVTGTLAGLNIAGDTLSETADASVSSLSALNTAFARAAINTPVSGATFTNLAITSAASGFSVDQSVSQTGTVAIASAGSLVISHGATVTGGDVSLSAASAFINNEGSDAVSATSGRWLIYSANPTGDTFGGLDSGNTAVWNTAAGGAVSATGNRYVFAYQPTLTVSTVNDSKTYGTDATSAVAGDYAVSGFQTGVTGAYLGDDASVYSGAATVTSAGAAVTAGVQSGGYAYALGQGSLASGGYGFSLNNVGTFTVNARPISVTADIKTQTYGDATPALTYTVGGQGLVNGDTLVGALATSASSTAGVGQYAITQSSLTNANNPNYSITYTGANVIVNARVISVMADDASRVYGDANPTFTYQVTGGNLVNGDTLSGSLTTSATVTSNVGHYGITRGTLANGNYAINFNDGDLAVTPRPITATANDVSRAYGDANPTLTYTVGGRGLVNGDTLSGSLAAPVIPVSFVGNYSIGQGTLAASSNYALRFISGNFAITPRPITVTADQGQSFVYGNTPTLTYTVGGRGLVNGDTLAGSLDGVTSQSGVGVHAIGQGTITNDFNGNYDITYVAANASVTPRALSVTADAQSRIYGNANPALTYAVGGLGLVNGDTLVGALATSANATSGVGPYAITQGSLAASNNYALTYTGADLTVTPRALSVTADAQSRIYGNANPALTYTIGGLGLVNGDTLVGALATSANATSGVGPYAITQGSLAASSNYALTYTGANLTVTPRALAVTADAQSRIYGDANPALTYSIGGLGLVNGDTLVGALATSATATSGVGQYAITQGSLAASSNYALTYTGANLTVTPRALSVTADAQSRIYGDANPALTYSIGGFGLVNGDTLVGALATSANATSGVGQYAITQGSLAASSNYALRFISGNFAITPRPITVTADQGQSFVYGNTPTLTYTVGGRGLVNGDTLAGTLDGVTSKSGVGIHAIGQGTITNDFNGNYDITYVAANASVTPRALAVTADAQSRIYGNANPALTYTIGGLGLVNGDTLSGALATSVTAVSSVGSYAITQGSLAASNNYALTYTGANLTVTPRALAVTADAQSRIYGNANPTLTYTIGGRGLVNGDTLVGALATSANATSGVGPYAITQGSLVASNNYALTYTGANLTVTPRALAVTADAQSRVYGDANPALTYSIGGLGLVNGDMLVGALATSANATSGVGQYAITQGSLAASNNYALTYTGANLTVTPRALAVTADAQSRIYGDANPALTYSIGGFGLVNGDTLVGALATSATATSGVGQYAITQGSLAASSNYALTYTGANLTVGARALSVTADAQSRVYGDANPALTYSIGGLGLVNGDMLSGALATSATAVSSVGSYAITQGSLAASSNYALTYTGANLTVTPRALAVTADAQLRIYGNANPALTYTIGGLGLVNGDTLSGALATSATAVSSVGSYAITQGSLAASSNYALTYTGAFLTIVPNTPSSVNFGNTFGSDQFTSGLTIPFTPNPGPFTGFSSPGFETPVVCVSGRACSTL